MLQRLLIILMCVLGAVLYGIVHDHITVRICLEYFNPGHPPIFGGTSNPELLAFGWGVIATWWVGFLLGVPLSLCCTEGRLPRITPRQLLNPLALTLGTLALLAALSGTVAYFAAKHGYYLYDDEHPGEGWPEPLAIRFATDHMTHLASYLFGGILGIALCVWALIHRFRMATARRRQPTPAA